MAAVTVKVLGAKRLQRELRRAAARTDQEIQKSLRLAGEVIIGQARKEFVGERTRARYKIKGGRRVRRKPPRPVTSPPTKLGVFEGTYRKQISQNLKGRRGRRFTEIGPVNVPYARAHEFGIGNMPKRPVFEPAVKKTQRLVNRIMGRVVRVILR